MSSVEAVKTIGKIFGILAVISTACACATGRAEQLGTAILNGANAAVELSIGLLGMMCLWNGVVRVLDLAGFTKLLSKLIKPFLKIAYPDAYKNNCAIDDIAADFSANLLGLGNAALPLGIKAMASLKGNGLPRENTANNDMVTLAVLNTTPLQLMPTTLIALRTAAGSVSPFDIILPIWICSVATTVFAVAICKLLSKFYR